MTKNELTQRIQWDEYGIGAITLSIPMIDSPLPFCFFAEEPNNPIVSDKMHATLLDVLALQKDALERIKDLLWEECDFVFEVSDYGCEPLEGEDLKQAHFRAFGLVNKEAAFFKSAFKAVHILHSSDKLTNRYAEIKMESATNNYISIVVKNGEIVDYDDDGTTMNIFETNNRKAHQYRKKTLGN